MKKKLEEKISNDSMLNMSNFGLRFPGLTGFGSKHISSPSSPRLFASNLISLSSPVSLQSQKVEHLRQCLPRTPLKSYPSKAVALRNAIVTPLSQPKFFNISENIFDRVAAKHDTQKKRTRWPSFKEDSLMKSLSLKRPIHLFKSKRHFFARNSRDLVLPVFQSVVCEKYTNRWRKPIFDKTSCWPKKRRLILLSLPSLQKSRCMQQVCSTKAVMCEEKKQKNKKMERIETKLERRPAVRWTTATAVRSSGPARNGVSRFPERSPLLIVSRLTDDRTLRTRADKEECEKRVSCGFSCLSCLKLSLRIIATCCLGLFSP